MSARRRRILIAVGTLEIGGAERQIVEVCRGLRDEFEFHVVTALQGGPLEASLREGGAILHWLSDGRREMGPSNLERMARLALAVPRFRRILQAVRPSLVHAYLFEMSVFAAAARWPRGAPPLIVSRRSLVRWIARGRLYFPVARWVNRHADVVLANSYAVRQDVAEREGLSPESIQVIYNGTDTSAITPGAADESLFDDLRIPRNLPVVGMIANLHSYKGHLEMVRAAALLAERGVAFSLLFVGRDGNASTAIRKAASEAGLSNIVYVGLRSDVVKILRTIDVVVSASHEEGFSNSILEAMAAGRPVVATGVGGTNEQIVDGVNGLLVPPYEPVALAEAVGRLLGSPALRERLGAAARGSVIERYSLQSLLENTRALYERLTAPAGVSGSSPSRR